MGDDSLTYSHIWNQLEEKMQYSIGNSAPFSKRLGADLTLMLLVANLAKMK